MKKSLEHLLKKYPSVKKKINGEDIPLTNVEDVFYQLALFIKDPDTYSFNINLFYKYLDNEDLKIAIQTIIHFFQKDTYLIQGKKDIFINSEDIENEKLYNQSNFAKYLQEEHGLKFSQSKIATYYNRGSFIKADLIINGTPYWYKSTVELYARERKEIEKNEKK